MDKLRKHEGEVEGRDYLIESLPSPTRGKRTPKSWPAPQKAEQVS